MAEVKLSDDDSDICKWCKCLLTTGMTVTCFKNPNGIFCERTHRRAPMPDTPELPPIDVTVEDMKAAVERYAPKSRAYDVTRELVCRERQLREAQATIAALHVDNKRLGERHVQFMVAGGPVVMASEYDALKKELEALRAPMSLCAPSLGYKRQSTNEEPYVEAGMWCDSELSSLKSATHRQCALAEKRKEFIHTYEGALETLIMREDELREALCEIRSLPPDSDSPTPLTGDTQEAVRRCANEILALTESANIHGADPQPSVQSIFELLLALITSRQGKLLAELRKAHEQIRELEAIK